MADVTQLTPRPSRRAAKRDEAIRRRVRTIRREVDFLDAPQFLPALRRYAALQILFDSLIADLRERGPFDQDGEPRPAVETLRRLSDSLGRIEQALALTPRSGFARRGEPDVVLELARRIRDQRAAAGAQINFSPTNHDGQS